MIFPRCFGRVQPNDDWNHAQIITHECMEMKRKWKNFQWKSTISYTPMTMSDDVVWKSSLRIFSKTEFFHSIRHFSPAVCGSTFSIHIFSLLFSFHPFLLCFGFSERPLFYTGIDPQSTPRFCCYYPHPFWHPMHMKNEMGFSHLSSSLTTNFPILWLWRLSYLTLCVNNLKLQDKFSTIAERKRKTKENFYIFIHHIDGNVNRKIEQNRKRYKTMHAVTANCLSRYRAIDLVLPRIFALIKIQAFYVLRQLLVQFHRKSD